MRGQKGTRAMEGPKGRVWKREKEGWVQGCLALCFAPCAHKQGEQAQGQGQSTGRAQVKPEGEQQRVGCQSAPHFAMHRARSSRKGQGTEENPKRRGRAREGRGARGRRGRRVTRAGASAKTGEGGD